MARHGGGAFFGKDPRRWIARPRTRPAGSQERRRRGLADRFEIELAYRIGIAHPLSVSIETFGTGQAPTTSSAPRSTATSTCAPRRSSPPSTFAGRSIGRPRRTATSAGPTWTSPGSAPTRRPCSPQTAGAPFRWASPRAPDLSEAPDGAGPAARDGPAARRQRCRDRPAPSSMPLPASSRGPRACPLTSSRKLRAAPDRGAHETPVGRPASSVRSIQSPDVRGDPRRRRRHTPLAPLPSGSSQAVPAPARRPDALAPRSSGWSPGSSPPPTSSSSPIAGTPSSCSRAARARSRAGPRRARGPEYRRRHRLRGGGDRPAAGGRHARPPRPTTSWGTRISSGHCCGRRPGSPPAPRPGPATPRS